MSDSSPQTGANCATLEQPQPSPGTPEPRFWKRYSPHHEFSLSTATSILFHGIIAALVLLVGWKLLSIQTKTPLPMEPIRVPGVGNQPSAGPGHGDLAGLLKETADESRDAVPRDHPADSRPESIKTAERPTADLPANSSDANARLIQQGNAAIKNFDRLREKLRNSLNDSGSTKSSAGDNSDGPGGKQGKIENRRNRILRWRMKFNTANGDDYRRQLEVLGAILAVPAGDEKYEVIRKLKPPARGKVEDLAQINRIFWVDDTPQSVMSLSQALKLAAQPKHIIAFFPVEFEEKLAHLEKNYRGKKADEIAETHFEIRPRGKAFEPVVVTQDLK